MTDISFAAVDLLSPLALQARDLRYALKGAVKDALAADPAPAEDAVARYGEARAQLGAALTQLIEIDGQLGAILTKAGDDA